VSAASVILSPGILAIFVMTPLLLRDACFAGSSA
jgi:hypothetical protein